MDAHENCILVYRSPLSKIGFPAGKEPSIDPGKETHLS